MSRVLGQLGPSLHGGLSRLIAGVGEEQLSAGLVVRHRALGLPRSQRRPCFALLGVAGAADVYELRGGRSAGDAVEHAAGSDRGELLPVADRDELCPGALDQVGEGVHAFVVNHPGLIEDHRRAGSDLDPARVRPRYQGVEGQRAPRESGAVGAEALGCGS